MIHLPFITYSDHVFVVPKRHILEDFLYVSDIVVGPTGSCEANRKPAPHPVQAYLAHKKQPPPQDHHGALGTGLL